MPDPVAQLVITLNPDGQVQVQGPVQDRILCYGLLEMAKEAISDAAKQQKPGLTIVRQPLNGAEPSGN